MRASPRSFAILFLAAQLAAAGNAIQFSASTSEFVSEGITYRRLVFHDDKRVIFYQPPANWKCSMVENRLHLAPNDKPFAEAQIESTAVAKPAALDASAVAAFAQQALAAVPPTAADARVEKQEQNSILVNNNPTVETTVSYKVMGDTFQRSVCVVCTPTNQIFFRLSARKADFDALHRVFLASIATWEWQPETNSGATAQ